MKKTILFLFLFSFFFSNTNAYASHNSWIHYQNGLRYYDGKLYNKAIFEFKEALKTSQSTGYYRKLALSYEAVGDYQNAALTYFKEAELYKKKGDLNTYFAIMKMANKLYSESELYYESPTPIAKPVLAKYEPNNGMYIGGYLEYEDELNLYDLNRFSKFNEVTEKKHSLFFNYHTYGNPFPEVWGNKVKTAGGAIHLALQPEDGLSQVKDDAYLREFARRANAMDTPIFLRFAAEANGTWVPWNGDPTLYKQKFCMVSNIMKEEAPNVVMVYAPSSEPKKLIPTYYPGDACVDWVGVSIYSNNFENGDANKPNDGENPLDHLDYVYHLYSSKKPIMVAEYAASHMSSVDMKDASKFSITKMQMMYEGIQLKYPRVKAIQWFSMNTMKHATRESRKISNYSLLENERVLNAYKNMIKNEHFLSDVVNGPGVPRQSDTPLYMKKLNGEAITRTVRFSLFSKTYDPYISQVVFHVNGNVYRNSNLFPYKMSLSPADLKTGKNVLSVFTYDSSGKVAFKKNFVLYKPFTNSKHIKFYIGKKEVFTEKKYGELLEASYVRNNRTMVPLRFISENLGANVSWEGKTKQITIEGTKKITLTVGSRIISLNGHKQRIEVSPEIKNGTTFVPIRFVSEVLGSDVTYNNGDKSVYITP